MFEALLNEWDGELLVTRFDRPTGTWVFVGIHSTRLGPATGGTRMKSYPNPEAALRDALRLSAAMTYKFAISGLPRGGGKAVLAVPPDMDPGSRPGLLRRYGALIRRLGGLYCTGPDVGTSAGDMDVIAEAGAPYVFGRTPASGGAGTSGPITGLGVFAGIRVVCEHLFGAPSPRGRRVLVQGAGSVGGTLIEHLREAGAEVLFNDADPAVVRRIRDDLGLTFIPPEDVFSTECDVFSPCALGGVLTAEAIAGLRCRAVAGGANNQLATAEDAERLRARGILYAPDYVVNVGGALGITGMESLGWSRAEAERRVTEGVQVALWRIFSMAATAGITTEAAACRLAEERLSAGA